MGDEMDIGEAVKAMRDGERVTRIGWNGKGMHLELQVSAPIGFGRRPEGRRYAN